MGRQVPRRVVPAHHAVPHRAAEENRPLATSAPGTDPQLLSGQEDDFQRDRGRLEQQGQSHHEKILRLSHVSGTRTGPLSLTWQVTRARVYPRFLLTTLYLHSLSGTFQMVMSLASYAHKSKPPPA